MYLHRRGMEKLVAGRFKGYYYHVAQEADMEYSDKDCSFPFMPLYFHSTKRSLETKGK